MVDLRRPLKTIGVVSSVALTLVAVAESSAQSIATISGRLICANALNRERSAWGQNREFSEYVAEATRRGLTVDACRQLLADAPSEFEGVWLYANTSNNLCKPSDWGQHDNDGLIRIAARKIQEWESECDVLDAAITAAGHQSSTAKVNLSCSGEGMTWVSTEIWHTQYVGARKALTRTQIEATNYRDDTGKSVENPTTSPISVRLYVRCN